MPKVRSELITLKEAAEILKISIKYAYDIWPSWIKYGVKALRRNGKGGLLFYRDEIYKMAEQWRIN